MVTFLSEMSKSPNYSLDKRSSFGVKVSGKKMNGANDFYVEQLKAKEAYKKFIYRRRVGLLLKDKNGIDKTVLLQKISQISIMLKTVLLQKIK